MKKLTDGEARNRARKKYATLALIDRARKGFWHDAINAAFNAGWDKATARARRAEKAAKTRKPQDPKGGKP